MAARACAFACLDVAAEARVQGASQRHIQAGRYTAVCCESLPANVCHIMPCHKSELWTALSGLHLGLADVAVPWASEQCQATDSVVCTQTATCLQDVTQVLNHWGSVRHKLQTDLVPNVTPASPLWPSRPPKHGDAMYREQEWVMSVPAVLALIH